MSVTSLSAGEKINLKDLIAQMVCTIQKEECFNETCDDCPTESITNILTHNKAMDLDDEC